MGGVPFPPSVHGAFDWGTGRVSRFLSSAIGEQVRIGRLQTNLLNTIVLKDVAVSGPVAIACPEVTIRFSWLNFILLGQNPNLGLARIDLRRPVIVVKPGKISPRRRMLASLALAPLWVTWENADVSVTDAGKLWDNTRLRELNGWLEVAPSGIETQDELAFARRGSLIFQGALKTGRERHWTATLQGRNADLGFIRKTMAPALRNRLPAKMMGFFTGQITMEGSLAPASVRLVQGEASVKLPQGTLGVKGDIQKPWSRNPQANLTLHGRAVDLSMFLHLLPEEVSWRHLPANGVADLDMVLKGSPQHPALHGQFSIQRASFSIAQLPPINGKIDINESSLNAQLNAFGGELTAQGNLHNGHALLNVKGKELNLQAWAHANGWRNIGGTTTLSLQVKGPVDNLSAQGKLEIEHFTWQGRRENNMLKGQLVYQNHQLVIQSQGDTLYVEAGLQGDNLALRRFHIISSQELWVKGSGSISGPDKTIDLQIEAKGLPLGGWPSFSKQYPLANGHFNFQGNAQGTLKKPEFQGQFSVDDLTFHPGSKAWRLQGALVAKGPTLELDGITANPALAGTGADQYKLSLRWNPGEQSVEAALQLAEADPSFLRDAAALSYPLTGVMNGSAKLVWKQGRWQSMDMQGSWKNGNVGPLEFESAEVRFKGDTQTGFSLDQLQVRQSSGTFSAQGRASAGPGSPWTGQGRFQRTQIGNILIDGQIDAQGSLQDSGESVTANLSSPSLFLNDYSLGSFQTRLTVNRSGLKVTDLVVAEGFEGTLETSFLTHELNGHLVIHDQDLKQVLRRILPETQNSGEANWPSGRVQGETNITGTWEIPRLSSTLSVTDGLWRQVPFQMDVELAYAHKLLMIEPVQIDLPTEGEAKLEGFVDFESSEPVHLYGEVASLSLPEAIQLLGLPPIWNGRIQATADMEGTLHDPRISVSVTGEHAHWGPVPAGPLEAHLFYDGKMWDISDAYVGTGDGHIRLVSGSSVYNDSPGQGRMRLVTEIRNIHLGPVTFFGGLEVAGLWRITEGKPHPVSWDLAAVAHGLWVNQQRLDGQLARCQIEDQRLVMVPMSGGAQTLSGEISFAHAPLFEIKNLVLDQLNKTRVELSGTFSPDEFNYALTCQRIDAETLASLFDAPFPVTGLVDLVMTASGPPGTPFLQGSFIATQGRFYNIPFDTCRADFSRYNTTVSIKNFKATRSDGYSIQGEGKFPTRGGPGVAPPVFTMTLDHGDLAILKDVWPACRQAHGEFSGTAVMKMVGDQPILEGRLNLRDARIQSNRYFDNLTDGNATLLLQNNRLEVEELTAQIGNGRIIGGGWMEFEGLAPSEYHLFLKTPDEQGISINVPQLAISPGPVLKKFTLFQKALVIPSQGQPRIDLALKGTGAEPSVSGTILLNNTTFTYPATSKETDEYPQWLKDFTNATTWDVTLVAGNKTRYQNELVDANLSGSLNFQGRQTELAVNGSLTSDRGAFVYAGTEFQIDHANFEIQTSTSSLTGTGTITPYLEAEAEKDIYVPGSIGADTVIMTIPRAPLGEIEPRFQLKSDPGLSSEKAMQLALGLPVMTPELATEQTALLNQQTLQNQTNQDEYLRAAVVQLFDASFASPLARTLASRSGLVDYIRVYYQPNNDQSALLTPQQQQQSGNSLLNGSGLKVGKELGHRLFANYQFRVDQYESRSDLRHEFELAYRIKNSLFLTASTEVVGAGDTSDQLPPERKAFIENQWRFAPPDLEAQTPEKNPKKGLKHRVKPPG